MDPVQIFCPSCGQRLSAPPSEVRREVSCPRCDTRFRPVDVIDKDVPLPVVPVSAAAPSAPTEPASGEGDLTPDRQKTLLYRRADGAGRKPPRSLLERLEADTGRRRNTTTVLELSGAAQRFIAETNKRMRIRLVMAILASVFPLLVLATALMRSAWRWVPGTMAALCAATLLGWGALALLPRLAERIGPWVLPGRAAWWLGGGAALLATAAGLITWGASAATAPLLVASLPDPPDPGMAVEVTEAAPLAAATEPPAHVKVGPGVLYIPKTFRTDDGGFDLLLHFHGNTRLVEESANEAGLNALVHVSNLGVESDAYERHFAVPDAFSRLLESIEKKAAELGVANARVERVAISSWSAGYGAVYRILQPEQNLERIDAVMMLDGLHLGYVDDEKGTIDERHLAPFLRFAESAAGKDKLFIVTHSEIRTHGYSSTSKTASILLAQLGAPRKPLDGASDSPPRVDFDEARKALPKRFDQWLEAKSAANLGDFHVWGYAGRTPEHHMAHLVQMSVTVLPVLVSRWK
jgi:hypothetical protein